jgi:microcystin-dependent protein
MTAILGYTSEIRLFPFGSAPKGWLKCEGQTMAINQNQALFVLIGTLYGGDGTNNFKLPDLRASVMLNTGDNYPVGKSGGEQTHALTVKEMPAHKHTAVASSNASDADTPAGSFWAKDMNFRNDSNITLWPQAAGVTGNDQGHNNMAPCLSMNYCICIDGIFPSGGKSGLEYIGEIKPWTGAKASESWLPCDGRPLPVRNYLSLFAVIKNTFGGDNNIFYLPDLRGKAAIGAGQGNGLSNYKLGDTGGVETVTLTQDQIPAHSHAPNATTNATAPNPSPGATWGVAGLRPAPKVYAKDKGTGVNMKPAALDNTGEGAAHNNMMPYQVVNLYIVWDGELPPHQ